MKCGTIRKSIFWDIHRKSNYLITRDTTWIHFKLLFGVNCDLSTHRFYHDIRARFFINLLSAFIGKEIQSVVQITNNYLFFYWEQQFDKCNNRIALLEKEIQVNNTKTDRLEQESKCNYFRFYGLSGDATSDPKDDAQLILNFCAKKSKLALYIGWYSFYI